MVSGWRPDPMLPALQKLADGKDAASAEAAKLVIARIEGGRGTGGRGTGSFPGGIPGGRGPGGGGGGGEPGTNPRGPGGFGGGGGFGSASGSVDQALKDLDLSDKQKAKLEDIKVAQQKKLADLMEKSRDGKLDREELRTTFEKNREEMLTDIKAVLTKDQIEKFEKALKDAQGGGRGGPGGGGRGFPGGGGPGGGGGGGPGGGTLTVVVPVAAVVAPAVVVGLTECLLENRRKGRGAARPSHAHAGAPWRTC